MAKKMMNWWQARHATNSGKTRGKLEHPDPAAAPLGTDDEAGGGHTSGEDIAKSASERGAGKGDADIDKGSKQPGAH